MAGRRGASSERVRVRATIDAILDAAPVSDVGYVVARPTLRCADAAVARGRSRFLARLGGKPYARGSRTVTLIDGIVLARSASHQSVNYRSMRLIGRASKEARLKAFVDGLFPGRWAILRPVTALELRSHERSLDSDKRVFRQGRDRTTQGR